MLDRPLLFVAGEWREPREQAPIPVTSPSTGDIVAHAGQAGRSDADDALTAARVVAESGDWARADPVHRIAIVRAMAKELEPKVEEILRVVIHEMGVPIRVSRILHRQKALESIHQACDAAEQMVWSEKRSGAVPSVVQQEAVGVVVGIAPWNGPFLQALYKIVYPLLAGCPVVYKPAPETPLDAYFIAEAFQKAGLPKGLLSILPGGPELGEYLVAHDDTDAVFFTGSTRAGRRIGAVCGENMKRMVLELGGKSAAIVLEDADLGAAVPVLASGAFGNTGQNCAATSRILVPRNLHDEVVDRLSAAAEGLTVGDPFDEATALGPLITERQRERVEGYVNEARVNGARIAIGGRRPKLQGWYYEPTVVTGVDNSARIAREEVFGPVVCVIPYENDAEAIHLANDSPYGLHGVVFTQSPERAEHIVRRIHTGTISVNAFVLNGEAPFGGVKQSGVGRKYGVEGLREFLEPKAVNYGAGSATFSFRAA